MRVLVTGGAGYVGSVLVGRLLLDGHFIRVLDTYWFGKESLAGVRRPGMAATVSTAFSYDLNPMLEEVEGDIRDQDVVERAVDGMDAVVHLAAISNDPSCELDAHLARSVNLDAIEPLVRLSKEAGVKRFIFASSGSVYGISDAERVTEDHPLVPVSDYNRYKGASEHIVRSYQASDFETIIIRPATVCGYSTRQRFDLTVNLLTNQAVNAGEITVLGGRQQRPSIHIRDMARLYVDLLAAPAELVSGMTFNAGWENRSVGEIAHQVKDVVERILGREEHPVSIQYQSSNDPRSYRLDSTLLETRLNWHPQLAVRDAVVDLVEAFAWGLLPNSLTDPRYFNLQRMRELRVA